MKLGIITFHQALNYGAILQTYALQHFLTEHFPEAEVQVVDYRCPKLSGVYTLKGQPGLSPFKKVIKTGHFFLKKAQFNRFIRSYITVSPKTYRPETVAEANDAFDIFLAGSDQIWNPTLTDGDTNYLLEFAGEEKRYSYAASIGLAELPQDKKACYRGLLGTFQGLSVREKTAKSILEDLDPGWNVSVHPDPVLLLEQVHWDKVCQKAKHHTKDYVFVFAVEYSEKLIRDAAEFAEKKGLDAIYIGPHREKVPAPVRYLPIVSLPGLLSFFRDARYVMVNSFHGTVFSLVFHKDFYVSLNHRDGRNSRIENLLELTGLVHRTDLQAMDTREDWIRVDEVIAQQRCSAKEYLGWVLKNEN